MDKIKWLIKRYRKMIKYLIFGVATTLVNWCVYVILMKIIKIDMTFANGGAWLVAVIFAYFTNRCIVFESKAKKNKDIIREFTLFIGARVLSGAFEIFLPTILYHTGLNQSFGGIAGSGAKAITSMFVIILNYIFSNLIIFKQ